MATQAPAQSPPRSAHGDLWRRVLIVVAVTIVVDLIFSLLVLSAERHAPHTDIHSFGTATFWTTTQLLTVSSQMANPLTTDGRILDVFLELYALTVVTSLAGMFAAFFHHRSRERLQHTP